ncbi:MAG TPA: DUF2817 domain-containing protein, partial [Sedimentisphaerales bacterium]|nr:DUF2817 domain-containing protein [Sedimentisphaerales bacterium]
MHYKFALPPSAAILCAILFSGCAQHPSPRIVDYGRPTYAPPVYTPPEPAPAPIPAPAVRVVKLGRSVLGAPIDMHIFGNGSPVILIFGGIHGNEYTSAYVARNLVFTLSNNPSLYADKTVAVIPAVNPDGLVANTRVNANGVDCNRNFPASNWQFTAQGPSFGGTRPASEPETRAIM